MGSAKPQKIDESLLEFIQENESRFICVKGKTKRTYFDSRMSSVLNLSGLNYSRGQNPLGRTIRALEAEVATLKKEVAALKAGGVGTSATPTVIQGPPGPAGPAGPTGPTGPAGPMAYIAMPPQFAAAAAPASVAVAPAPVAVAAPAPESS